jgi:hypothetical protein
MRWSRFLLVSVVIAVMAAPAPAGFLLKKKKKPNPVERVPELLAIVKTDPDDHKRASAAQELRQFDIKTFPDIVPILADVLRTDAKASVRLEAAQSLARIRPVSQEAGMALEHAASNDAALRVRMQARTSLVYYRLSGYHSPKKETAPGKPTGPDKGEPPLAPSDVSPKSPRLVPVPNPSGPHVKPVKPAKPPTADPEARPLPMGPARSPLVPTEPPKLDPPPTNAQGPPLTPPY